MPVIEINYTKAGVKIEVNGMQGPGCLALTQAMLEHHAGADGKGTHTTIKQEFSLPNENRVDATIFCG
jgi:hypothetical protein